MTNFMEDSLELLPQPAALFECPNLRFISANTEAVTLANCVQDRVPELVDLRARLRNGESGEVVFNYLDIDRGAAGKAIDRQGFYGRETPFGVVYMTRLATSRELTRPDLVIVTLHPDTLRETAYMQHERMVVMLRINEAGYRSVRMMEDALMQMQAALSAQRDMLMEANHKAARFFRLQANLPVDRS